MEARRQFSRLGWAYVLFFLVSMGMQLLIGAAAVVLEGAGFGRLATDTVMLLSQFSMYGIGFPVFYFLVRRVPAWKMTKPQSVGTMRMILVVVFCFGLTYLGNMLGQLLMTAVGAWRGISVENPVDSLVMEMRPWTVFLSTVLIAPVMEELMFRKLLMDRTVQYGQKVAVIVSGVSFGLFHGNFFQFFYACAIGMVFAYLYSSTGRIRYSIILHMIINFVGGFVSLLLTRGLAADAVWALIWIGLQTILMIGSMVAAIVLACIYRKRLRWFSGWAARPECGISRAIFLAPGVLGFLAMSVLLFVTGI